MTDKIPVPVMANMSIDNINKITFEFQPNN